jgi:hypothetical protein
VRHRSNLPPADARRLCSPEIAAVPPDIGVKVARLVNEGIAAIMAREKAHIPAATGSVLLGPGGTAAAEEVDCAIKTRGLQGVEILAHVSERELFNPDFQPF